MRFGGHETFAIRPGWLGKGLRRVTETPGVPFDDPATADALGVGRNMAKAIRHWLQVTGLAEAPEEGPMTLTGLGRLVLERDPYAQHAATWWACHAVLVTQPAAARAWRWFFGELDRDRLDRPACIEELRRALERSGERVPSPKTLARDVTCLLQSYAEPIPPETGDPEDASDCPLRRLGLVVLHRDTGIYERRAGRRVPPELLGLVVSLSDAEAGDRIELTFSEALVRPGGPGRVLGLDAEGLAELAGRAEAVSGGENVRVRTLGVERVVSVRRRPPEAWLRAYHNRAARELGR